MIKTEENVFLGFKKLTHTFISSSSDPGNNKLRTLPPAISELRSLRELSIGANELVRSELCVSCSDRDLLKS